jgi:hypothetical protein
LKIAGSMIYKTIEMKSRIGVISQSTESLTLCNTKSSNIYHLNLLSHANIYKLSYYIVIVLL